MGRVNCQQKGVFKQLIFNALDIEFSHRIFPTQEGLSYSQIFQL